jgi:tetratricopeptide (TPR) repeat protein
MTDDDYDFDLGSYSRPITTRAKQAQLWFDRGLMWCYGYNHAESVSCFRKAAEIDPDCALAYWGIAYASGSNYNKSWAAFGEQERVQAVADAHQATKTALALMEGASPVEQGLIAALGKRYQSNLVVSMDEFNAWNEAYAGVMKNLHEAFSDDLDVSSLYAEALINRTPWALWDLKTGKPAQGADTLEAIRVLESAMKQAEDHHQHHPGVLHMYIHVMEMSPHPEKALRACDALHDLVPDAGHLLHMPSHIDLLCGYYYNAVVANNKAIAADTKFLNRKGPLNFYTLYRCHDYHFKIYAAMFMGQYHGRLVGRLQDYENARSHSFWQVANHHR